MNGWVSLLQEERAPLLLTGGPDARVVQPLGGTLDGPLAVKLDVAVRSGRLLVAAPKGTAPSPILQIVPSLAVEGSQRRQIVLNVPGPADQIVVKAGVEGTVADLYALAYRTGASRGEASVTQARETGGSATTTESDAGALSHGGSGAQVAESDTERVRVTDADVEEDSMPNEPHAPLVDLQPGGSPAIISYHVPEPMSFSGRNYIDLALPAEAFASVQRTDPSPGPRPSDAVADDAATGGGTGGIDGLVEHLRDVQGADALQSSLALVNGGADADDAAALLVAGRPVTDRLGSLTRGDVKAMADAGQRVIVHPAVGGLLDFRVVPAPSTTVAATAGLAAGVAAVDAVLVARERQRSANGGPEPNGRPDPTWRPELIVFIDSPQSGGSPIAGPAAGAVVKVSGRWRTTHTVGAPAVAVTLDGASAGAVTIGPGPSFSVDALVSQSGVHTIAVTATADADNDEGETVRLTSTRRVSISVELSTAGGGPVTPPTVTISAPKDGTLLLSEQGSVAVTAQGTAAAGPGASVANVTLTEGANQYTATPGADGKWSIEVPLSGTGAHTITAVATDATGLSGASASRTVQVSDQQPFRRLLNRLLLVETLNLSAFLGNFGAGRVIKTFSLLPGESTTIAVKSYTKTTQEQKSASSIVDSNATDSADDFEDSLSSEQSNSEALTETSNYKVGASASAGWGWGSASINAEFSGSANAARQEAVKNVSNATRKHSLKASTNRNVTINTEYQVQQESGVEESTTRTISNINVSRTLNFVFRQMNQQHVALIHLTNVRVAYYTEDLMLDADGKPAFRTDPVTKAQVLDIRPTYQEMPLPQLQSLLDSAITADYREQVRQDILHALSGIPDYQDQLKTAFEFVVPKKDDGTPVPTATYMQFPRGLSTTVTDPEESGASFTVPGIVLGVDVITMRTEGVMVDAVLGPGEGLDAYSQKLQEVALAERQVAVAERQAEVERQTLARKIVADKDDAAAAVFAKVFPPPPAEGDDDEKG
jgi:hypothetical protein